jgi:hypothetical protein
VETIPEGVIRSTPADIRGRLGEWRQLLGLDPSK